MSASLYRDRLSALRQALACAETDAWILRTSDPYLSEYVPAHWDEVAWLSGFTGSTALMIVTSEEAALFTDSRYWEQAEKELCDTGIVLVRDGDDEAPTPAEWLNTHLPANSLIGLDTHFFSETDYRKLESKLAEQSQILAHRDDLIDDIWTTDRPIRPQNPVFELRGAGDTRTEKLARIRNALQSRGATAICVCALDEVAWLTNCRGSDIAYNPVFLARALVTDTRAILFTEKARLGEPLCRALEEDGFTVAEPGIFATTLESLSGETRFFYDPERTPAAYALLLKGAPVTGVSPVTLLKSHKTPAEIASIRKAMIADGTALCEFYAELEETLRRGTPVTETGAADILHRHRAAQPGFLDESFESIVAVGSHAALPHYTPNHTADTELTEGLLLIDSGAQYKTGTTDITRMTALGRVTPAMKSDVTAVLKGMIALASAVFPTGTSGAQLDTFARAPLWAAGLDYGHGTGHGVGYILNVHEGPFSVSPRANRRGELGIQPGNVLSDEPGVYRPGQWGVRIENLLVARPCRRVGKEGFLEFEVLTLCPIDLRTVNKNALTRDERLWLNRYHERVRRALAGRLSARARRWLGRMTKAL